MTRLGVKPTTEPVLGDEIEMEEGEIVESSSDENEVEGKEEHLIVSTEDVISSSNQDRQSSWNDWAWKLMQSPLSSRPPTSSDAPLSTNPRAPVSFAMGNRMVPNFVLEPRKNPLLTPSSYSPLNCEPLLPYVFVPPGNVSSHVLCSDIPKCDLFGDHDVDLRPRRSVPPMEDIVSLIPPTHGVPPDHPPTPVPPTPVIPLNDPPTPVLPFPVNPSPDFPEGDSINDPILNPKLHVNTSTNQNICNGPVSNAESYDELIMTYESIIKELDTVKQRMNHEPDGNEDQLLKSLAEESQKLLDSEKKLGIPPVVDTNEKDSNDQYMDDVIVPITISSITPEPMGLEKPAAFDRPISSQASNDPELLEMQLRLAALESTLKHNYRKNEQEHESMKMRLAETFKDEPEEGELVVNKEEEIHNIKMKITKICQDENKIVNSTKKSPRKAKKDYTSKRSGKVASRALKETDTRRSDRWGRTESRRNRKPKDRKRQAPSTTKYDLTLGGAIERELKGMSASTHSNIRNSSERPSNLRTPSRNSSRKSIRNSEEKSFKPNSRQSKKRQWHAQQRERILNIDDPAKQLAEFNRLLEGESTTSTPPSSVTSKTVSSTYQNENYETCSMELESDNDELYVPSCLPCPLPSPFIPPYAPSMNHPVLLLPPPPPPPPKPPSPKVLLDGTFSPASPVVQEHNHVVGVLDKDYYGIKVDEVDNEEEEETQALRQLLLASMFKKKTLLTTSEESNQESPTVSLHSSPRRQVIQPRVTTSLSVNVSHQTTTISDRTIDRRIVVAGSNANDGRRFVQQRDAFNFQVTTTGVTSTDANNVVVELEDSTSEGEEVPQRTPGKIKIDKMQLTSPKITDMLNNLLIQGRKKADLKINQDNKLTPMTKSSPAYAALEERLKACKSDLDQHKSNILNDKIRLESLDMDKKAKEIALRKYENTKRLLQRKLYLIEEKTRNAHIDLEKVQKEKNLVERRLESNMAMHRVYESQWQEIKNIAQAKDASLIKYQNDSSNEVLDQKKKKLEHLQKVCESKMERQLSLAENVASTSTFGLATEYILRNHPSSQSGISKGDEDVLVWFRGYRLCASYRTLRGLSLSSATFCSCLDPELPLCPFAISGQCADYGCPWQHPRDFLPPLQVAISDLLSYSSSALKDSNDDNLEEQIRADSVRMTNEGDPSDSESILIGALNKLSSDNTEMTVPMQPRHWKPRAKANMVPCINVPYYRIFTPETRKMRYYGGEGKKLVVAEPKAKQVLRTFPKKRRMV